MTHYTSAEHYLTSIENTRNRTNADAAVDSIPYLMPIAIAHALLAVVDALEEVRNNLP